jgi:hypothetical protein
MNRERFIIFKKILNYAFLIVKRNLKHPMYWFPLLKTTLRSKSPLASKLICELLRSSILNESSSSIVTAGILNGQEQGIP